METYLIELKSSRAYRLLKDLEALNIIKVLRKNRQQEKETHDSGTARFWGVLKLSNEEYLDFQQHAKDIRNEWRENI